jgi:type I restriction enzyme S subunit
MSGKKRPTSTMEEAGPALVPKLRFPEFRGTDRWMQKPLGAVCDLYQPVTLSSSELSMTGEHLVYGANGVIGSHSEYNHEESEIAVTCRGATCGEITITKPKSWITGNAMVVKPKTRELSKAFIFNYLKRHGLKSVISGTAQPQITRTGLAPLDIYYPSSAEQQKIAECLSSLDELIAAQARKVDALKTHKKGLMQQLFPREGGTQPRLRFPEFRDAGEWELNRLDELVDIQSGATPSKANPAFWNGSVPWVSAKDMKRLYLEDAEDRISAKAIDHGARLVPPGTILILTRGMTLLKDVPICVLSREMSFNQDVKGLRTKDGFDELFLAWILIGNKHRLLAMVNVAGHGTGKLDTDELKALELTVPSIAEQKRIAACLSSLDTLITAETNKLGVLKTHKKGLMQQLFPAPETVED